MSPIAIIVFLILVFLMGQFLRPLFYDYRMDKGAIAVVVFRHWVIYKVPVEDIVQIRRLTFLEAVTGWTLPWGTLYIVNRLFADYVAVVRRGGRTIVITPATGVAFFEEPGVHPRVPGPPRPPVSP